MARVLDFANAMAGLNCTKLGARGGIATQADAERLIAKGGRRVNAAYANGPAAKSRPGKGRQTPARYRR